MPRQATSPQSDYEFAQRSVPPHRPAGRPREFELDAVLEGAINAFRRHGYAATSVRDLTEATGLTAGSLYKAFDDKRALFMAALAHYGRGRAGRIQAIAAQPGKPGRMRLEELLHFYAAAACGDEGVAGCLVVASAVELGAVDADIAARVDEVLRANRQLLAAVIREGQADGSLPATLDAQAASAMLVAITQGLRVIGKTGRSGIDPTTVVDFAMQSFALQ